MKPPPLLIGAALLFWGWQTDYLVAGAVMAVVIESARFIKVRWEFSNEDFSRIWVFCSLLFLAAAVYAFTANNGPSSFGSLITNGVSARSNFGNASTKTAVLLMRWLPMAFFLFVAAQTFSNRDGIPLETISLILQRRWRAARKAGRPLPTSRAINVGNPYFIICLVAASGHSPSSNSYFFWGLCGLMAWALWPRRSARFGWVVWAVTMTAAIALGYFGQLGLMQLKNALDQYSPKWLGGSLADGFDPLESRTEIGQIGQIKMSHEIVVRLETKQGEAPPYLREAAYRLYRLGVWYTGSSSSDFGDVPQNPPNSEIWPLISSKTNFLSVNIGCYLTRQKGLLPLPTSSGRLEQLPAFTVQKNSVGAVRAEGPGIVVFDALYGPGSVMDSPPDNDDDLNVPDKEKPALKQIISQGGFEGQTEEQKLQSISQFFATKFSYSLTQDVPRLHDTNITALGRFLLTSRSGHCEYFASATVLLLRELKIPARYVVGYAVHEALGDGKFVVRQSDAHAWCRVWNEARGAWEDFDTTPGSWLASEEQGRSSFQGLWDGWSRFVFEFSRLRWGQSNLRQYIIWFLVPVLALLLYQIIFRSGRRRAKKDLKSATAEITWPGLDSEFYELERRLVSRGFTRNPEEPLTRWLQSIAREAGFSELGESLRGVLILHYRYRFDPLGLNAEERDSLRREVAKCAPVRTSVTKSSQGLA
jgi:hypothetical protein